MIYRAVKLVTTLRPNLGFFPRTPAPPCRSRFLATLPWPGGRPSFVMASLAGGRPAGDADS